MSLGFTPLRRRFERLLATFSAVAVLMSMMVIFAPAALAHHSYLNASSSCTDGQINLHIEAYSWTNTTTEGGRYNSNIEIRLGSTSGTLLGSGKFLPANSGQYVSAEGYDTLEEVSSFAGTGAEFAINVNANAYAGQTLTLYSGPKMTPPDSDWWNTDDAGPEDWSSTTVTIVDNCTQSVTVQATPQVCVLNQGVPQGAVSFDINPASGGTVQVYANPTFTGPVGGALGDGVSLSLAPGTYYWQATAASGFALSGPSTGQFTIAPCGASVLVVGSACVLSPNGAPLGQAQVTIDPTSGATVVITGPGGPYNFFGSGGTQSLAPGQYSWQATAAAGFALSGPSTGQFTIAPCGASTVVVSGNCVVGPNGAPLGQAQVTIDPTSGATVVITGPGGPYDFFGSGGTQSLAPGQYSWQATPAAGFALTGPGSGQFTIALCTGSVIVSSGVCDLLDGPLGPVDVTIDPNDAATVTIYSDAAMTNVVTSFADDGGSTNLAPGTYYWEAEAESGFALEGATEGQFTIEPCEASTVVVSGGCSLNEGDLPVGLVEVTIDPDSGATVVVSGPGGPYDFSGSGGSQELAPGSYSWEATAAFGFALTGDTAGEFDVEPCDVSVVVASGECQLVDGPFGSVTVFIDADSGAMVTVYDAEMNVAAAFNDFGGTTNLVPGTYTWAAVPGDGFEFPQDQATSGEFTIAPCPSTVLVSQGACLIGDGPLGSVLTEIDPDSGATVIVRDSALNVVATFTGIGGSIDLPPGSYTWTVEAADGFSIVGETTGQITIEPCGGSAIVSHGNCVEGAPTAFGSVTVAIAPEAAASVIISDSSHLEVAVFGDAGGEQTLLAGDYTWSAVAAEGYELTGATSGTFVVVACDDEVGGVSILPFTGMDSEKLLGASILLLGLGIYLIHFARRGEEG